MENKEIKKRLYEFANFLDQMEPSFKKGILSRFFTGYAECYKKLFYYEYNIKEAEKGE